MKDVEEYAEALNRAVADEIRGYRAKAGKTQRDIYEAAGISKSKYIRLEKGSVDIGTRDIALITGYLGVEPQELMKRAQSGADKALGKS